jgi:hypothetical protein
LPANSEPQPPTGRKYTKIFTDTVRVGRRSIAQIYVFDNTHSAGGDPSIAAM